MSLSSSSSSVTELSSLATNTPILSSASSDYEFDDAIRQALDEQGVEEDQRTKLCHVVQMDHDYVLHELEIENEVVVQSTEPLMEKGDDPSHSIEQQERPQVLSLSTNEDKKLAKSLKRFSQQIPMELEKDSVIVAQLIEPFMAKGDDQSHSIQQKERPQLLSRNKNEGEEPVKSSKRFRFSPQTPEDLGGLYDDWNFPEENVEDFKVGRFKLNRATDKTEKAKEESLDEDSNPEEEEEEDNPAKKTEAMPSSAFKTAESSDDDFDFDDIDEEDVKKPDPVSKSGPAKTAEPMPSTVFKNAESSHDDTDVSDEDEKDEKNPDPVAKAAPVKRAEAMPSAVSKNTKSSGDDSDESDEVKKDEKKSAPAGPKKAELKIVFFDLETTGIDAKRRHDKIQICTISAYHEGAMFEAYLKPTNKFQPGATAINGMSMYRGNLLKNGKKVESAETMISGLTRFIAWMMDTCEPEKNDKIVLVAHSCHVFDAVVLLKNLREVGVQLPTNVVFGDTMSIMRKVPIFQGKWPSFAFSLDFFFGKRQRDHNAESNTHNLVQLASAAAKYLGYKDFCNYLQTNSSIIKRENQICL